MSKTLSFGGGVKSMGAIGPPQLASHYTFDSLGGSLNLRPEELDRLDASQLDPIDLEESRSREAIVSGNVLGETPSISFDSTHYRNLEASINGTINSLQFGKINDFDRRSNLGSNIGGTGGSNSNNNNRNFISNNINSAFLTPPPSSSTTTSPTEKPHQADAGGTLTKVLKHERSQAMSEMQKMCDHQVERLKRTESERFRQLEGEYKQQLGKLQQDLDSLLQQHQQVIKLKNEVESGLQMELDLTRRDLRREKELRESDKERYQRSIRELNQKIRDLERRIGDLSRGGRGKKSVSFADESSFDDVDYDTRLARMQRENDGKIANLVKHFEKEKAAALEILKTKIRAEVSLLIPRIKEQFQRVYAEKAQSLRESLASQFRDRYEEEVRQMKEEHALERRLWQRQIRDRIEEERMRLTRQMKQRYELKIMDMKNECERRILDRLGGGIGSNSRRHENEDSMDYEDGSDDYTSGDYW